MQTSLPSQGAFLYQTLNLKQASGSPTASGTHDVRQDLVDSTPLTTCPK